LSKHSFLRYGPGLPRCSLLKMDKTARRLTRRLQGVILFALACTVGPAIAEERANFFNDPFIQITGAIKECPVPEGPMITCAEMQAQTHGRAERGTSCFQSGRCRLPNSYLYDKEIIPRVKKAIEADGRFMDTSVWAEGQRRWVWLKGCVHRAADAQALEQLVRQIEDVENVINELVVK
jgi:hypothetical protein